MKEQIKQIRRTIGLLSSMVSSGENHSKDSQKSINNALSALESMEKKNSPVVSAYNRKYSPIDLMRYHTFRKDHPEVKPVESIALYNDKFPPLTEEQKKKNLMDWIKGNID
jgi:hypothetical protein